MWRTEKELNDRESLELINSLNSNKITENESLPKEKFDGEYSKNEEKILGNNSDFTKNTIKNFTNNNGSFNLRYHSKLNLNYIFFYFRH